MAAEYVLHEVRACNLCKAPISRARVLGRRLSASQGVRPTRRIGWCTTVMRCGACGLVFANPLPLPRVIGQHYDRAPEDYWTRVDRGPGHFAYQIETFRGLWDGGRVPIALDVGAGTGESMTCLAAAGFDVHGVEPSPAFRDAAVARGVNPDRLALGPVETISYAAGTFDFVAFGAVLEHLPDPAEALQRALGWLAPGGLLWLEVPSARWLSSRLANLAYRLQGLDYVTNLSPMHVPFHLYEFTAEGLRAFASLAAVKIVRERVLVGQDTFLPGPDRAWRWLMERTGTGMQIEMWLRSSAATSSGQRRAACG